jgi:hypothetical protein
MYFTAPWAPMATPGTGTGPPFGFSRPTFTGAPVGPEAEAEAVPAGAEADEDVPAEAEADDEVPPPVDVAELQAVSAVSTATADAAATNRILELSMRDSLVFMVE